MKPENKFQRKIIFIKKAFQYKFIAFVLAAVLFGMSFVFYEFVRLIENIFKKHPLLLQVFFEEGYGMFFVFGAEMLICFAVLALITAVISNRIAGPMYKLEITCKKIAGGDLGLRAYLRAGDACADLAAEFNKMMDALEARINAGQTPQADKQTNMQEDKQ
ncbi:MAG: methyl-accepting chemotaxis protein [Elusimicrobiota bacterium]|jgi:methyl-accepting chemotaxis protein|nr:methyl-accepting chemotaxis protein [Elusimicrobiota bacterium]